MSIDRSTGRERLFVEKRGKPVGHSSKMHRQKSVYSYFLSSDTVPSGSLRLKYNMATIGVHQLEGGSTGLGCSLFGLDLQEKILC